MSDIKYSHLADLRDEIKQALGQERTNMVKAALIKFFELAYEQSWKILKKILLRDFSIEALGSKDTFREAAKVRLIDNPEAWFAFIEDRNETVHSYNVETADRIVDDIEDFIVEFEKLILALDKHNDKS